MSAALGRLRLTVERHHGAAAVDDAVIDLLAGVSRTWSVTHFRSALLTGADARWPLLVKAFTPSGELVGVTGAVARQMSAGGGRCLNVAQLGFGAVRPDLRGVHIFPELMYACLDELATCDDRPAVAYGFSTRPADYAALMAGQVVDEWETVLENEPDRCRPDRSPVVVRRLDLTDAGVVATVRRLYDAMWSRDPGPLRRDAAMWRGTIRWSREDPALRFGVWEGDRLVAYVRAKRKRSGLMRIADAFGEPGERAWRLLLDLLRESSDGGVSLTAGERHPLIRVMRQLGAVRRQAPRMVARLVDPAVRMPIFLAVPDFPDFYLPHADRL